MQYMYTGIAREQIFYLDLGRWFILMSLCFLCLDPCSGSCHTAEAS